jgi:addiction module RelE/StbE family toxin
MVQLKWTKSAIEDLREIADFIAKDSPYFAQLQVERIKKATLNLKRFPKMGRRVPEFSDLPYREIIVGNYRVFYRIDKEKSQILIMSVMHSKRLLRTPPDDN